MINYANRCFTFGKPVRRDTPANAVGNTGASNKIDDIQRRFNRVALLKQYFSKVREDQKKKFDFPIDQQGRVMSQLAGNDGELYDQI